MATRRLRLHHRIVIPFVLVAIAGTAGSAFIAMAAVSNTFVVRVQERVDHTAGVLHQSGFALNQTILQNVKAIASADVVTFTADGQILASTFAPEDGDVALAVVGAYRARPSPDPSAGVELTCRGPCYVAYRALADRPDAVVAVVAETSETTAAAVAVARTIVLALVASVAAMILVSQLVARRVTAPLDRLVMFTKDIASGQHSLRAAVGEDEVGRVGAAFNDMLDRLDRSQAALVRSEKLALAGLLAARVAHDIRNPLSSIKIQTELLADRLKHDPDSRQLATAMLDDIAVVELVIRDLIELARPGDLKKTPSDLNDLIRTLLAPLEARLGHRKIALFTDLDRSIPLVALDDQRFRQALMNVVINAADAMPEGGILSVTTALDADGTTVSIKVMDEGVGIDPDMIARVFDPFVSSKPGGIGLGLVNARGVVEHHGGSITLAARSPRGTCATITLPVD